MKPIIMSTEDVRALLDGRKTMARLVIKPQPTHWDDGERVYEKDSIVGPEFYAPIRVDKDGEQYPGEEVYGIYSDDGEYGCKAPCQPGDVLYVRETWVALSEKNYLYQADGPDVNVLKIWRDKGVGAVYEKWMSPVTMPHEAARLFLRVTDVRVERLHDITQSDVFHEGFRDDVDLEAGMVYPDGYQFKQHWDSLNAKRGYGWDTNPFCWVIEFKRVEKGAE